MVLNLDPKFAPLGSNTIRFKTFIFSGGEPHIKIESGLTGGEEVMITTRIRSFNDFGLLLCAIDALKRMRIKLIHVFIPYFPAARQDRVMVPGEPLSVKVYADILNHLNLASVTVFDPHSEVTPALINDCLAIPNHTFVSNVLERIGKELLLICPDGGALKKIYKVSEFLGGMELVECSKKRNVKNGQLEGFTVYAEDLNGKDCLIVDDICDGGGTFLGLAKALKNKNAGNLYLAVSHGIFSRGLEELNKYFTQIFTTDSFRDVEDVEQISLKEILKN
jgi:ribose-phosphate pyrophosphokinase